MTTEYPLFETEEYPERLYTERGSPPRATKTPPPRMYYVCTTLGPQEWLDDYHVMVSAGLAWRNPSRPQDQFKVHVPEAATLFIDSGGYQAAVHFRDEYPYSPRQLFEWAEKQGADYVAGMDWACEESEELTSHPSVDVEPENIASIPTRIERCIEDQIEQARVYEEGNWSFDFVPVVQGYSVEDYRYCARRLREEGVACRYMGIGTVCKRAKVDDIRDVLGACREELPHTAFHLFGATRNVWKDDRLWGDFVSADTHAWARNTPEGNWPKDKDDKRRSFYHYREKMADTIVEIDNTQSRDGEDDILTAFELLCKYGDGKKECICGTVVPMYGDDFEPGCRNCENTHLTRQIQLTEDLDQISPPKSRHASGSNVEDQQTTEAVQSKQ